MKQMCYYNFKRKIWNLAVKLADVGRAVESNLQTSKNGVAYILLPALMQPLGVSHIDWYWLRALLGKLLSKL